MGEVGAGGAGRLEAKRRVSTTAWARLPAAGERLYVALRVAVLQRSDQALERRMERVRAGERNRAAGAVDVDAGAARALRAAQPEVHAAVRPRLEPPPQAMLAPGIAP